MRNAERERQREAKANRAQSTSTSRRTLRLRYVQEIVTAIVNQLLELGVIVRSEVERASQVLLVPKPAGGEEVEVVSIM